jgi:hypothetical protein
VSDHADRLGTNPSTIVRALLTQWARLAETDERDALLVLAEVDPVLRRVAEIVERRPGLRPEEPSEG